MKLHENSKFYFYINSSLEQQDRKSMTNEIVESTFIFTDW